MQKSISIAKSNNVTRSLRDFTTALEASFAMIGADPSPDWIRHLRACSRHVESEISLLELTGKRLGLERTVRKIDSLFKQLDRVSSDVREIDAQTTLLEKFHSLGVQAGGGRSSKELDNEASGQLESERQLVRKSLKRRRIKAVLALHSVLKTVQGRLIMQFECLLGVLVDESPLDLTDLMLFRLVSSWFKKKLEVIRESRPSNRKLHAIRKAAKTARYMAETSSAPRLQKLAAVFKNIQQAGGIWHDTRQLHRNAVHETGPRSALSTSLRKLRNSSALAYTTLLEAFEQNKGIVLSF
jgi:CHAD domain-containing protein